MSEETSVENYRNLGHQKVSGLSSELEHVKKFANIDDDSLTGTVLKMGLALSEGQDFVNSEMKSSGDESGFLEALEDFIQNAEGNIMKDCLLLVIVRDFLIILDKSSKQVRERWQENKFQQPQLFLKLQDNPLH
ncbi:hypothetical protein Bca52824_022151 [Brassica carinata]|uniref:Uncharacterized protein n=1 Tax=Brassica carinata TaxID=52824 RepID=A0A8X7VG61_BRACI|nr:hypothetical protein Bca52824_022151 [Brassica carinata]